MSVKETIKKGFKMKKLMLAVLLTFGVCSQALATPSVFNDYLKVNGSRIDELVLTSGTAVESDAISVSKNTGFASLVITESDSGDVDVYVEYSIDKVTWSKAYTSDMAGAITVEGNVVEGLSDVTRWIVFTPRLAPFMRVVLDPDANSEVTARIIYQKD